jgi:hypothetical protein
MACRKYRKGIALLLSMIVLAVLSAWVVSINSMSNANVQLAENQHKVNSALSAAHSAMECGKYIAAKTPLPETSSNIVTPDQANDAWDKLCNHVQAQPWVNNQATKNGNEIITPAVNFGAANASFQVKFYRDPCDVRTIKLEGIGTDGQVKRQVSINMKIQKGNEVLNYAVASRGRMWLTGNTTIHGNVFSPWDRPEISPFNMTSDTTVLGTINTVLTREEIEAHHSGYPDYKLETLDENGNPIDVNGNPLGTNYEARYYSPDDEIQAYHQGINYGQPDQDIPGMDISDYDTTIYKEATWVSNGGNGNIPSPSATQYYGNDASLASLPPTCGEKWRYERFPHNAGDYTTGSGIQVKRYIYKDQTFTDQRLPENKNALFINCTFNGVLYVDCGQTTSNYNNVRYDNCTFNGTIVSNTPQSLNWQRNCLYFTGAATFNNQSGIQEATILAPHFNVNLGNTNPEQSDNNILTGAIVGGIVDVRGNAQIYGTIISMCDTTQWSSGYVTNIGATLDDGGSETTELGDIGVISITPEEDTMLPSGIKSPIVIKPLQNTYSEGV